MNHLDLALFWKVAENIWLGHARDGISRPVKFCVKISARRRPPKLLKVRATPAARRTTQPGSSAPRPLREWIARRGGSHRRGAPSSPSTRAHAPLAGGLRWFSQDHFWRFARYNSNAGPWQTLWLPDGSFEGAQLRRSQGSRRRSIG